MALSAVRPLSSLSLAVFWWVLTRLLRLLVKYLSPTTSTVIIRVAREHYRTLWAALTLLRKVGGHECIARVVHVSGKLLNRRFIQYKAQELTPPRFFSRLLPARFSR